jgi:hypothetical protein
MPSAYLIWQVEHLNEHLMSTAQARAETERAAQVALFVRHRRRRLAAAPGVTARALRLPLAVRASVHRQCPPSPAAGAIEVS